MKIADKFWAIRHASNPTNNYVGMKIGLGLTANNPISNMLVFESPDTARTVLNRMIVGASDDPDQLELLKDYIIVTFLSVERFGS